MRLDEMSNEQLWELFPIFLVPHKKEWAIWFKEESEFIKSILPKNLYKHIIHMGSTSIPNIYAKDIVDIMVISDYLNEVESIMINNGYRTIYKDETHVSMNKGYTEKGFAERVFHLHIKKPTDIDEIYFKEYLLRHPDVAKEYEKLKLDLWKKYEHNRDGYTDAKTEFISKYTKLAKKEIVLNL